MRVLSIVFCLLCVSAWAQAFEKNWVRHTADVKMGLEAYHATAPLKVGPHLVYANALDGVALIEAAGGRQLWRRKLASGVASNLVVATSSPLLDKSSALANPSGAASGALKKVERAQGQLFFGASDAVFYCLDLATGQKQWSFQLSAPLSGLTYHQKVLYLITGKAMVWALQARTGRVLWSRALADSSSSDKLKVHLKLRPQAVGDRVVVAFGDGVWALNKSTGKVLWGQKLKSTSSDTLHLKGGVMGLVLDKPRVYVSHFEQGVVCLNLADGELLWRSGEPAVTAVSVSAEALFYATRGGAVEALSVAAGKRVWRVKGRSWGVATQPVFWGDRLVLAWSEGPVQILDSATGRSGSEFFTGQGVWATPLVTGDSVYVMSSRAHLWALKL